MPPEAEIATLLDPSALCETVTVWVPRVTHPLASYSSTVVLNVTGDPLMEIVQVPVPQVLYWDGWDLYSCSDADTVLLLAATSALLLQTILAAIYWLLVVPFIVPLAKSITHLHKTEVAGSPGDPGKLPDTERIEEVRVGNVELLVRYVGDLQTAVQEGDPVVVDL